jgi:hypothetical protein
MVEYYEKVNSVTHFKIEGLVGWSVATVILPRFQNV